MIYLYNIYFITFSHYFPLSYMLSAYTYWLKLKSTDQRQSKGTVPKVTIRIDKTTAVKQKIYKKKD